MEAFVWSEVLFSDPSVVYSQVVDHFHSIFSSLWIIAEYFLKHEAFQRPAKSQAWLLQLFGLHRSSHRADDRAQSAGQAAQRGQGASLVACGDRARC